MQAKQTTGQNIDSYCGKCKLSSDHTIMTMNDGTVEKVRCKTCGSTHKFKSPAYADRVRKPRKKSDAGTAATTAIVWADGLAKAKGAERNYSMASKYRIGEIVNHQTFGKGIVVKLLVNKCNMLFEDGEKLMVSTNQ